MPITLDENMYLHYWGFAVFIISAIILCIFMLLMSLILGGKSAETKSKNLPFESGVNPVERKSFRLAIKFYLIAMFFVIFEVESVYLYVWAVAIRDIGWIGLLESAIFIIVLFISLIYLVRLGGLDWKSTNNHSIIHSTRREKN
ncbi:NADH-quinone oxidoreductase subunit A [Candidatus Schneideria nysicola]|uniref:NADH-quinone oxidoreductase subunit A n=1 Tax=Candidatus Schneideria nysicola TaxID=1081631 RepID=UPI001CAA4FD3|nr:NADH-quinone oxidoreductase subunit A [Candidatus Schneideria nysicola]UAJ65527.1 NADH-quinone oxidoreductase subunit A [Candidatus Schneideria nysicola]